MEAMQGILRQQVERAQSKTCGMGDSADSVSSVVGGGTWDQARLQLGARSRKPRSQKLEAEKGEI
jgi:hypothetical protein